MAVDLSTKSVLVIDQGLYCSLAERLARDFARVSYFAEWRSAFPRLRDAAVGEGLPGVERCYDLWDAVEKVDLIVFPDCGYADLQQYLRRKGHRVWGAGASEWLELDRSACRNLQREIGVAAPETVAVKGLAALRAHLETARDVWVKTSTFRGDLETAHHLTAFASKPWLDDLATKYGPLAEGAEFLVESNVEGVEVAYDCYSIDGKFPGVAMYGLEVKDAVYLGAVVPYANLPEPIKSVNAAFAPVLARDRCRSFHSFEMRVRGAATPPVVIDPCMRCGSPGSEAWAELFLNLGEIMWEGAGGKLVDPVPAAKFAAVGMLSSPWALTHWTPILIPPEVRRFIKLRNETVVAGHSYYVPIPEQEMATVGAVVGLGDTVEAAIESLQATAERLDGYQLSTNVEMLPKALAAMREAQAAGIDFGG